MASPGVGIGSDEYRGSITSADQQARTEIFIRRRYELLPGRTQHALLKALAARVSYEALYRTFIAEGSKLVKSKNAGLKTLVEIEGFLTELQRYVSGLVDRNGPERLVTAAGQ